MTSNPEDHGTPSREPVPWGWAVLIGTAVLTLYVITLAPTTQFWDSSEYIAAARVLGIPHPPGNPLFVLFAHVWGLVPLAGHYAVRINLLAACSSAGAAALWFLIGERFLQGIVVQRGPRHLAAAAGAAIGATAFTVWNQSVVNEKVYTLSLMSIAIVLWLAIVWGDRPLGPGRDRLLLLIVYLLALTSTVHMMGVLIAPAVSLLTAHVIVTEGTSSPSGRRPEVAKWYLVCASWVTVMLFGAGNSTLLVLAALSVVAAAAFTALTGGWRFAAASVLAVLVGLSVNVFLPIRAGQFPPINEGEPVTLRALWSVLTRAQYDNPPVTLRQTDLFAQLELYWHYFRWQWSRGWQLQYAAFGGLIANVFASLFAGLGLLGAWRHWRNNRGHAVAMTAAVVTFSLALVVYLNFKYGFSQRPDEIVPREVRERDYFFVVSFALWGVWVGIGLATLAGWIVSVGRDRRGFVHARRYAPAVFMIALIPVVGNWRAASRAGETLARDFAVDLLAGLEPYSVLVTSGDNDTFPLWYVQEVEGLRRDVTIVPLALANTDWYLRQLQRRPVRDYDAAVETAWFEHRQWTKPERPLFSWSEEELNDVPVFQPLGETVTYSAGDVAIVLSPSALPSGGVDRATVAVLQIIGDQLDRRPIYFSQTTGPFPDQLGLTPYLATEGFARRLYTRPLSSDDPVVESPGAGLMDTTRSRRLLWNVYRAESATRPRALGWVDTPSEQFLRLYATTYRAFGLAVASNDPALSTASLRRADSVLTNVAPGRR